ncbi:MAG: CehA/McbA family metallohydrolase [Candidatus Sericytochromatia bacterium]
MSSAFSRTCAALSLLLAACQNQSAQQPLSRPGGFQNFSQNRTSEYKVYFGNLHSHTAYSDGILNPREAYRMAQGNGLDFMAVTEHNHSGAAGTDQVYLTPQLYEDLKRTAKEFSVEGKFAALYGQEFSTISKGNHLNIFNASTIVNVPHGDFKQLYEKWLPAHPEVAFIQFNHPNVRQDLGLAPVNMPGADIRASHDDEHGHRALEDALSPLPRGSSDKFNDYGYDDYGKNFATLAKAANPWVRTLEILNGPGTSAKPVGKAEAFNEEDYFFYLNEGFKVAPSADQDNHYAHWGSLHTGRTGVLAKALTPDGIYEAIRARRVFASEDQNLELVMQANGQFMGSDLAPAAEVDVLITLKDPDEPQASYLVQLFGDQLGQSVARPVAQQQLPAGQNSLQLKWTPTPGQPNYAFVKVSQLNANGSQDDAWTAPVWITPARR